MQRLMHVAIASRHAGCWEPFTRTRRRPDHDASVDFVRGEYNVSLLTPRDGCAFATMNRQYRQYRRLVHGGCLFSMVKNLHRAVSLTHQWSHHEAMIFRLKPSTCKRMILNSPSGDPCDSYIPCLALTPSTDRLTGWQTSPPTPKRMPFQTVTRMQQFSDLTGYFLFLRAYEEYFLCSAPKT